jgi:catechol 2,3-dioxygenase
MVMQTIHPDTALGYVHLAVSDLNRSLDFYEKALGFRLRRREKGTACLGAGQADLLMLTEIQDAARVPHTTGLYHFAILVPSRLELARSLKQLVDTETPVEGFADHLVSEAIYLSDPDGNGIEIYRDRPRSAWEFTDGHLKMATDPLDVAGLLVALKNDPGPWSGLHRQASLGHIHLHVADIALAEAFYRDVLGFELMLRYGPSASFLSAGGYHHHIGINTWAGPTPPPPDTVGLRWFLIRLPDDDELGKVATRVRRAGLELEDRSEGLLVRDPAMNGIVLTTR